jgi:hypothetical protein
MPNMVFKRINHLFIVLHTEAPPSEAEWKNYIDTTLETSRMPVIGFERMRHLIFTKGGGPNAGMRAYSNRMLEGRTVMAAVVSDSTLVRGIVNAAALFNKGIKAFSPTDWPRAFAHLNVDPSTNNLIWWEIQELGRSLPVGALQGLAINPTAAAR